MNLDEALVAADRIRAKQTYLTHLTHEYNHHVHQAQISQHHPTVQLAWDGLWVEIS